MAATQFLCFGEYIIYQGVNSYSINSCELNEVFYNIRMDLDKLQYVSHITRIVNDVTDENQNTYRLLQLFLNTLYVISETDKDLDLVIAIFKLKLLCLLGLTPIIDKCTSCKKSDNIILNHFSFRDDGLKCDICSRQDKGAVEISEATINAIKYIVLAPPKKLFSFNLSENGVKELSLISQIYLNEKLDKEYKLEKMF